MHIQREKYRLDIRRHHNAQLLNKQRETFRNNQQVSVLVAQVVSLDSGSMQFQHSLKGLAMEVGLQTTSRTVLGFGLIKKLTRTLTDPGSNKWAIHVLSVISAIQGFQLQCQPESLLRTAVGNCLVAGMVSDCLWTVANLLTPQHHTTLSKAIEQSNLQGKVGKIIENDLVVLQEDWDSICWFLTRYTLAVPGNSLEHKSLEYLKVLFLEDAHRGQAHSDNMYQLLGILSVNHNILEEPIWMDLFLTNLDQTQMLQILNRSIKTHRVTLVMYSIYFNLCKAIRTMAAQRAGPCLIQIILRLVINSGDQEESIALVQSQLKVITGLLKQNSKSMAAQTLFKLLLTQTTQQHKYWQTVKHFKTEDYLLADLDQLMEQIDSQS